MDTPKPTKVNSPIAASFSKALDTNSQKPNYTQRELDTLKENSGVNAPAAGYDELKKARDDSRRAYENGRDIHIAASKTKDGYLPGTSRDEVGYNIPDAQRKYAKHFIDEVSTPEGFGYTNTRRVQLGMKPLDVPNPDKIEMRPKNTIVLPSPSLAPTGTEKDGQGQKLLKSFSENL